MATIQRINIIGSREGSRNRRRLKANQTGKKFRVGIKSNISTNRNNLISGVDRCIHLNAMKKTTITSINRQTIKIRSEERFSRNAETDLVCRLLLEKKNKNTERRQVAIQNRVASNVGISQSTFRAEERLSWNAETDLVCRLLFVKYKQELSNECSAS